MKTMKTKSFDAVAESRRWKEAASRQTKEMTRDEVLAFFSKEQALAALSRMRHAGESTSVVREESAQG